MTFKYRQRSAKDHKARTVKQAGAWATLMKPGIPEFRPKEGSYTVRFCLPTWEDAKHWAYDIWVNNKVGAGFGETFLSLKLMKQKPDPVAEAIAAAKAEGEGASVKGIEPRKRAACYVIEKGEEDKGPQFWSQPPTLDTEIAALAYDDEDSSEVLWVDDPKKGHWVSFKVVMEKTPEGTFPKYKEVKVHSRKGPMSKDVDQQAEWIDFVEENPIPDILQFYSYDHIKAALDGAGKSRKKDEDEEEDPPKRRRARNEKQDEDTDEEEDPPKRRSRPKIDDDEAELDEEDDEPPKRRNRKADVEEDEDEPAPKKRRKREVEEDDEEEETPKRRHRKAEPEDEDEDGHAPKKRKRKSKSEDDDEDEGKDLRKSGGLKKRRRRSTEEDDD